MLAEALEGGFQAYARVDWKTVNTQCRFDFSVRCNVVFGKLANTLRIQRQMQKIAELSHTRHKTLVNFPDVRFLTHRFTDNSYQFVGRFFSNTSYLDVYLCQSLTHCDFFKIGIYYYLSIKLSDYFIATRFSHTNFFFG